MVVDLPIRATEPLKQAPAAQRALVAATRKALDDAERVDTPLGAIALELAGILAEGGHTASGVAALSKELRGALSAALDGAPQAPDLVDELKARRERRRGA